MKSKNAAFLVFFATIMYGFATIVAMNFEEYVAPIYFMAGIIFAAVGFGYDFEKSENNG